MVNFHYFQNGYREAIIEKTSLDPKDLKNYRPVSNLSFISKVLEKVVLSQILSAAFDTIAHEILLHRLHNVYAFGDTVLYWFQSYLENRTQIVTIHLYMVNT